MGQEMAHAALGAEHLAGGGDGYTTFTEGKNITNGPVDINALVAYVGSLPQPVNVTVDGRINRLQ